MNGYQDVDISHKKAMENVIRNANQREYCQNRM
jgi:hypothetical protein